MSAYDYDAPDDPPYDLVPVEPAPDVHPVLAPYRDRILVHTVHDGSAIPRRFRFRSDGSPIVDPDTLDRLYVEQRDWGADLVAGALASALGLPCFGRVRMARALLDFNRFPGSTPPNIHGPFERLAISEPFAEALDHGQKTDLLESYYDRISDILEEKALHGKLLTIAVHTYDEHNPSLTVRPEVSVITRPVAYQRESRMPYGVFDPMYPDRLGASTCSRILRDRITLNLERAGFRASHNHPYALPDGSLEVRAQVWYFFQFLRERFEDRFPKTHEDPAYRLVWSMLLNTNLRLADSEALRGYLHRYRRVSAAERHRFQAAQVAYEKVRSYLQESDVLDSYRHSPDRPSSFGVEIRKDLVCRRDPDTGVPLPWPEQSEANARKIAGLIAGAIAIYFETDRRAG